MGSERQLTEFVENRIRALDIGNRPNRLARSGEVAQLVEHGIENAGVPGSSPGVASPRNQR